MTGIGIDRLKDWLNCGFVVPGKKVQVGKRWYSKFSDRDIKKVLLFNELLQFGFKRKRAAEIVCSGQTLFESDNFKLVVKDIPC